jgi:gamma-glutamyl phosphate reductase
MTLGGQMTELAKRAKDASRELAKLTTENKNACLQAMAAALEQQGAALPHPQAPA